MPNDTHFHTSDRQFQESCAATVGLLTTQCKTFDDPLKDSCGATVGLLLGKSPTVVKTMRRFSWQNDAEIHYLTDTQMDIVTSRRIASL